MEFYWGGFIFWSLILASAAFVIWGTRKKSSMKLIAGALFFAPIAFYFSGAENSFRFIMFTPVLFLIMAFLVRKKRSKLLHFKS